MVSIKHFLVEAFPDAPARWPMLAHTIQTTREQRRKLVECLKWLADEPDFRAGVVDLVLFGSLAREDATHDSDVDWTLVVDGESNIAHFNLRREVTAALGNGGFHEPGKTGTFGSLTFSHEIVHHIGGEEDTHKNLTRRMLMLLESHSLRQELLQGVGVEWSAGESNAYQRVLQLIIARYLHSGPSPTKRVPRFLLNDIVRYWRTICVDYARKEHQEAKEGQLVRYVKLRTSRKLIFASGLLIAFMPELEEVPMDDEMEMQHCLARYALMTPLQVFLRVGAMCRCMEEVAAVLSAYDAFLRALAEHRAALKLETVPGPVFDTVDKTTEPFQDALDNLFYNGVPKLNQLVKKYGLF